MTTTRYAQLRFTNKSGTTTNFPWMPHPYNGVRLSDGSSVLVPAYLVANLRPADRTAYNYALQNELIQREYIPGVDPQGTCEEEINFVTDFPIAADATYATGAQADIFDSDNRPPTKLEIVSVDFHVKGVGATPGGDGFNPGMSRAIGLFNGATQVAGWENIAPTGSAAPSKGEVVRITNINPTAATLQTGDALSVHITAGMTSIGATGTVRVHCVPTM